MLYKHGIFSALAIHVYDVLCINFTDCSGSALPLLSWKNVTTDFRNKISWRRYCTSTSNSLEAQTNVSHLLQYWKKNCKINSDALESLKRDNVNIYWNILTSKVMLSLHFFSTEMWVWNILGVSVAKPFGIQENG